MLYFSQIPHHPSPLAAGPPGVPPGMGPGFPMPGDPNMPPGHVGPGPHPGMYKVPPGGMPPVNGMPPQAQQGNLMQAGPPEPFQVTYHFHIACILVLVRNVHVVGPFKSLISKIQF